MKTFIAFAFLLFNTMVLYAQKSITINVETLTRPASLLPTTSYQSILESLILSDKNLTRYSLKDADPGYNMVAKSNISQKMVNIGYHPFFEGMYDAYADHRPFTLSPDMIWLLICQGFSNHVNNNSEMLRHLFVNFEGKSTLVVVNNKINLDNPNSPWQEVFPEFSKQISAYTGKELTQTLTADFSTTTPVSRVTSQITLMDAMKSYFNFIVISIGCGIPKVTLEGSTQDWEKVLAKTEALRKYQLDWWVDKMEPPLKEIIKASKGAVNKPFWQDMFKYHSKKECGAPTIVDGWIVKFFPYNKNGKRNNLDSISLRGSLPNEVVKVDLEYKAADGKGNFTSTPLELWAGFMGISQNDKTFSLKPEIGWMIRKQDKTNNPEVIARLKRQAAASGDIFGGGIMISAKTVPPELLEIGPIHQLEIDFIDSIQIPEKMSAIKIDKFKMTGAISQEGINRIAKLFPKSTLIINGQTIRAL